MKYLGMMNGLLLSIMALFMFVLVTQQYGLISWKTVTGMSLKEGINGGGSGYYIMTNATVDEQGNSIFKTMDTTGYFNVISSERSKFKNLSGSSSGSGSA